MFKHLLNVIKAARKQARIDKLNTIIEQSASQRAAAKERALAAQTERDALLAK